MLKSSFAKYSASLLLLGGLAGSNAVQATTPVIDGDIDPGGEGWTLIGSATDSQFWAAEAGDLYFAHDVDYIYLAATKLNTDDWPMFGFILDNNTTDGATTNPWARQFNYEHTTKPVVVLHGNWNSSVNARL